MKADLIWLAGFVEADGSVGMYKYKRRTGNMRYAVRIVLTNCDPNLINACDSIIRKYIGVTPYLFTRERKEGHAKMYQLTLSNFANNYKFLKALTPYMKGTKRAIGCMTMRFLESRGVNKREVMSGKTKEYKHVEHSIYNKLKPLMVRGIDKKLSPETERRTLISDDTVRTRGESTRDEQK